MSYFNDFTVLAIAWLPLLKALPSAMGAVKGLTDDDEESDLGALAQAGSAYSDYASAEEEAEQKALDDLMKKRRMAGG